MNLLVIYNFLVTDLLNVCSGDNIRTKRKRLSIIYKEIYHLYFIHPLQQISQILPIVGNATSIGWNEQFKLFIL